MSKVTTPCFSFLTWARLSLYIARYVSFSLSLSRVYHHPVEINRQIMQIQEAPDLKQRGSASASAYVMFESIFLFAQPPPLRHHLLNFVGSGVWALHLMIWYVGARRRRSLQILSQSGRLGGRTTREDHVSNLVSPLSNELSSIGTSFELIEHVQLKVVVFFSFHEQIS